MIKDLCLNQAPRARLSAAVNEHSTSDCSNAITHIIEADELTLILNNSVHYCTYYLNPNCKAAVLWIVNNEPQTPCALGEVLHTLLHFEVYLNGSFAINSVFGVSGAHLIDYFFSLSGCIFILLSHSSPKLQAQKGRENCHRDGT